MSSRPECTCGPGINKCPADIWWAQVGSKQVAREFKVRSWEILIDGQAVPAYNKHRTEHSERFTPARRKSTKKPTVTQEVFESDIRAWIAKHGRLPSMVDFDSESDLHHSSRWIYRFYGSLPAFWHYAVDHEWVPEHFRLEKVNRMKERRNTIRKREAQAKD